MRRTRARRARAKDSLDRELDLGNPNTAGRRGAILALARAGRLDRLEELLSAERDPAVAETIRSALGGDTASTAFRSLEPSV